MQAAKKILFLKNLISGKKADKKNLMKKRYQNEKNSFLYYPGFYFFFF
jgi:hypothetical protein